MIELPLWASVIVAVLMLFGSGLTLLGCIGLVRFSSFYARVHAPTLGTSFGVIAIAFASMLYFTIAQERAVVHEILIVVLVTLSTPVTLMLLARAALHRDRAEGKPGVPQPSKAGKKSAA